MTIYLCISSMRAQLSYMSWENTLFAPKLFRHRIWWQNYANVFINQIYYLKFQNIIHSWGQFFHHHKELENIRFLCTRKCIRRFFISSCFICLGFKIVAQNFQKYFHNRALPSIPKLTVCAQIFKFHLCKQMHSCKNQLLCYWIMHHYNYLKYKQLSQKFLIYLLINPIKFFYF